MPAEKAIVENNIFVKDSNGRVLVNFSKLPETERKNKMRTAIHVLMSIGYEIEYRHDNDKFELKTAYFIGDAIVKKLAPFCEQVAIAGSVRRRAPLVKDIEIVCQPKEAFQDFDLKSAFEYRTAIKDGKRYKQLVLPEGIKLDLFIVRPPAQWGMILAIRTGDAEFSKRLVTNKPWGFLPIGYKVKDGAIWKGDELIETPDEQDVFRICGMNFIYPEDRSNYGHFVG